MRTVALLLLCGSAVFCFGMATAGEQVALALRRAGIAVKEAAFLLGISQPRLYAFFRDESALDVRRLARLPLTFHEEYDGIRVKARGGVVLHDARLTRLLDCVEVTMAKATLPSTRSVELPLGGREEKVS